MRQLGHEEVERKFGMTLIVQPTMTTKRSFTLLELILSVAILALFLFVASDTLVRTLEIKGELEHQYDVQKVKATGWNILYQDLGYAVGIYYHHVSLWEGEPTAAPKEEKAPEQKLDEKKKKKGVRSTSDELFAFDGSYSLDEPFMEVVVSKGRMRSNAEDQGLGFRKVKYYLISNPDDRDKGETLMRSEEAWIPGGGKNSRSTDKEEEFDLEEDYRKYALIENLSNVSFDVYNGTEWIEDEWSSLEKGDLPLAFRIHYDLLGEEPMENLTRIIPLPISYLVLGEPEEEF